MRTVAREIIIIEMAGAHASEWLSDRTDRVASKVGQGVQVKLDPNHV